MGSAQPSGSRLRTLAGSFQIGCETDDNFWTLPDTTIYQQTAAAEFNMITPGNQLKWDTTEPQQGMFNFAPGDMHAQFALQHGMAFHGHVLVWHNQLPGWLTGGNFNATQLTAIMRNHIANQVGHYKGTVAVWDVVNEAFNDDGTRRSTIWQNTIGPSFIELAFQAARAADSNVELLYNDFNIETVNAKSNAVFAMVQDFKNRGIPIDAVGFQGHLTSGGIDAASFASNMQRFASLGVKVRITELDVRLAVPATDADLQKQANIYQAVLNGCLSQPACKSVQTWGITDKYSWIPGTFPGFGAALLFDASYAAKSAYFAVQTRLGGTATPDFSLSASPASVVVTQGALGSSTVTVAPIAGFTNAVSFSASGLPAGVTASFSPTSGSSTKVTFAAAATAAPVTGAAVTITGTSGTLTHSTPIALTVTPAGGTGGGNGGVTITPVINSNSPWFDDQGVKIANTSAITALSVTITVQNTGGIAFSGQYNTVGGPVVQNHSSTTGTITYQFSLSPGQTLGPGTSYLFDAQMSGTGVSHPTTGDTFTATYTTGGANFTQTGHF
jgi:GH35 family endo-1,4-beta-xylanase